MTTVLVSGAVANKHRQGGSIWVRMSWAEALRDAGLDVVFVEQIDESTCVDAEGAPAPFEDSANAAALNAAAICAGSRCCAACAGARSSTWTPASRRSGTHRGASSASPRTTCTSPSG